MLLQGIELENTHLQENGLLWSLRSRRISVGKSETTETLEPFCSIIVTIGSWTPSVSILFVITRVLIGNRFALSSSSSLLRSLFLLL